MKGLTVTAGLIGVIALLLIGPLFVLWGLNTISEQSAMGWYIPHNMWTYLAVYATCGVIRGGK